VVIFDLFGTLVHFDVSKLPLFEYQNEEVRCTTQALYELASHSQNEIPIDLFHQTLTGAFSRLRREKTMRLKEFSCLTRMKILLSHLRFPENRDTEELAIRMKEAHMECMKACVYLPEGYRHFMQKLSPLRMGLLSNFDDRVTGHQILEELGLSHFFHTILFSEEAGMIKPHSGLFNQILARMEVHPSEVLFVGDTPEADILGPKKLGMGTAWINPEQHPFPEAQEPPDIVISTILELESFIQI
jgi:HAD superfamily hydrolase (TIGR01549 family)